MSLPVKILLLVQIPVVYVRIWGAVIEEFYLKIMGGFFLHNSPFWEGGGGDELLVRKCACIPFIWLFVKQRLAQVYMWLSAHPFSDDY